MCRLHKSRNGSLLTGKFLAGRVKALEIDGSTYAGRPNRLTNQRRNQATPLRDAAGVFYDLPSHAIGGASTGTPCLGR